MPLMPGRLIIHQDDVGAFPRDGLQRGFTVGVGANTPESWCASEQFGEAFAGAPAVFDDGNFDAHLDLFCSLSLNLRQVLFLRY